MSDRTGFIVSFDGPGVRDGRIDVRDLAPALLSLGRLIDAANVAVNGDKRPIKVEAKAVSAGSFEVLLDVVVSGWAALRSLLEHPDAQATKNLLEWIGILGAPPAASLIAAYRFLGGKRPDRVAREPGGVFRIEIEGRALLVPFEVLRLYQEVAVNKAVRELLATLESETVDRIDFRPESGAPAMRTLTLTKEDRRNVVLEEAVETVLDETRRLALSIRGLAFQDGNKWRLFDGQNTVTAAIEDREFLNRVDLNLVRFAKGDVLLCEVRTVQTQGPDGLRTEHFVLRVLEHRQAAAQIALPLD